MADQFLLRNDKFNSISEEAFKNQRSHGSFHDVVLVSSDMKKIPVHRLILSTFSDYFKTIFDETEDITAGNNHQLVVCIDLASEDLNFILDFVYQGEVKFTEKYMENFLALAERFKLKGLTEQQNASQFNDPLEIGNKDEMLVKEENVKAKDEEYYEEADLINLVSGLETPVLEKEPGENVKTETNHLDNSMIEEHITKGPDGFTCNFCGKNSRKMQSAEFHLETHIEGLSYKCNLCDKTSRSRNGLKFHKYTYHTRFL